MFFARGSRGLGCEKRAYEAGFTATSVALKTNPTTVSTCVGILSYTKCWNKREGCWAHGRPSTAICQQEHFSSAAHTFCSWLNTNRQSDITAAHLFHEQPRVRVVRPSRALPLPGLRATAGHADPATGGMSPTEPLRGHRLD